jgi:hypothetical protein
VSRDKEGGAEEEQTYVIDGADSPCESDKGEGGVDVEGKLSSIANRARDKGNEAINTSDLVEHLRTSVSRAGRIGHVGLWGPHCKENNKSDTGLEIEKTKHRSERPRPEMLLKSKLHGEHIKRSGKENGLRGCDGHTADRPAPR